MDRDRSSVPWLLDRVMWCVETWGVVVDGAGLIYWIDYDINDI